MNAKKCVKVLSTLSIIILSLGCIEGNKDEDPISRIFSDSQGDVQILSTTFPLWVDCTIPYVHGGTIKNFGEETRDVTVIAKYLTKSNVFIEEKNILLKEVKPDETRVFEFTNSEIVKNNCDNFYTVTRIK